MDQVEITPLAEYDRDYRNYLKVQDIPVWSVVDSASTTAVDSHTLSTADHNGRLTHRFPLSFWGGGRGMPRGV